MQQVNLYLPEFRPKFNPLGGKSFALVWLIFLVVLGTVQWSLSVERERLASEFASSEAAAKTAALELDRQKKIPKGIDKASAEDAVNLVQAAIRNREYAQAVIQSKNLGNDKGFSPALTALASLSSQDVTLSEFVLTDGGRQVALQGLAKKGAAVPDYLHRLQGNSSFSDSDFGVLQIEKSSLPGRVTFSYGKPKTDQDQTGNESAQMLSIINR